MNDVEASVCETCEKGHETWRTLILNDFDCATCPGFSTSLVLNLTERAPDTAFPSSRIFGGMRQRNSTRTHLSRRALIFSFGHSRFAWKPLDDMI